MIVCSILNSDGAFPGAHRGSANRVTLWTVCDCDSGGLVGAMLLSIFLLPTLYVWVARDNDRLPTPEASLWRTTERAFDHQWLSAVQAAPRLANPIGHQWNGGEANQEKYECAQNVVEHSERLGHWIFSVFGYVMFFGLRISPPTGQYRHRSV